MANESYVICARRVKQGAFVPEPGPIKYLKVAAAKSDPTPDDEIAIKQWVDEVRALAAGQETTALSPEGAVLVFVHGYNNSPPIVLARQRQLQQDLGAEGWAGIVASFDWPSANSTLNYLEDRADASTVALTLVNRGINLLAAGQATGCKTNVHLLGHSTGAYVIMEAFAQAQKDGALYKSAWHVTQLAFIAGDVSSESLAPSSDWAAPMYSRLVRFTNYSNPFDEVLAVSNAKRLGTSPRAGRVGLTEPRHAKAINVDCGEYFSHLDPKTQPTLGTFNHSWYIGNRVFARDLAMTLEGSIDRFAIPTRRNDNGRLVLQDRPRLPFQASWNLGAQIGVQPSP